MRVLEPFERLEFGVWPFELTTGRFCRVWHTRSDALAGPYFHTEVAWDACLRLYAVPLRAMRVFYGPGLHQALPDWAVADLERLPPVRTALG